MKSLNKEEQKREIKRIKSYRERILELEEENDFLETKIKSLSLANRGLDWGMDRQREIIKDLESENRKLIKELVKELKFLNNEEFECGCDAYNGFECGLCKRKAKLRGLLESLKGVR